MKKTVSIVCDQVIYSRKGEVIGSREIINEIYDNGTTVESVTRAVLKLADGRVVANRIIRRQVMSDFKAFNLLTGSVK